MLLSWPAIAGAQSYATYGADRSFPVVDWQVERRGGSALVSGHILNDTGFAAQRIRVRVEEVDAAGQVVTMSIGYVPGMLTPASRGYFEVPVAAASAQYRVSVLSFDLHNPFGP